MPTDGPSNKPMIAQSDVPTDGPSNHPSVESSDVPTDGPSNDPTTAPIVAPTPAPTIVEEAATKPPIATHGTDDDDTDDLVFPPICAEDIEVIKRVGMTDISLNKEEAIRIVSQDRDTVTVQLQQAWESPPRSAELVQDENVVLFTPWIDYVYYAYRPDNFDEVCFEETKVEEEMVYAKDITIQCAVTQPYALLEICIADDIRNERLQFNSAEENGVVPKCCHPTFPPETTPVVCYTVKINCVTECVVDDDEKIDVEKEKENDNLDVDIIRAEDFMAETRHRRRTLLRGSSK